MFLHRDYKIIEEAMTWQEILDQVISDHPEVNYLSAVEAAEDGDEESRRVIETLRNIAWNSIQVKIIFKEKERMEGSRYSENIIYKEKRLRSKERR